MTRFIFWSLMAIVALTPLPFASNRPWSWSLLSLWVGLLLIFWALTLLFERPKRRGMGKRRSLLQVRWPRFWIFPVLFLPLVVWLVIQASSAVPAAWYNPLWSQAATVLGENVHGGISLNPVNTITATMRIIAYGGVFWLAFQYGRRDEWARYIMWTVCVAGSAYALYGLYVHFSGDQTILWYKKWAYLSSLTSTFVNRNTYATYAGLTLLAAIALMIREMRHSAPLGLTSRAGWLEFLDNMNPRLFFLIVTVAMIATALLLTQSRGGFISTLIGVFVLFVTMAMNRGHRGRTLISALVVTMAAGYILLSVSGAGTLSRLAGTGTGDIGGNRQKITAITLEAISQSPAQGTGLGTFEDVFHRFRGTDWYVWTPAFDRAHNSYLEFTLEIGLIPTLAVVSIFLLIFLFCLRGVVKRRRNAIYPCVGVAATALVGTHALLDFSMQLPAVAVTYFALAGMAFSQSWGSGDRQDG